MYRLKLSPKDEVQFKSLVRRTMIDKRWKMKDLAEKTGYSVNTLYMYFSRRIGASEFVSAKIAEVLGITKD